MDAEQIKNEVNRLFQNFQIERRAIVTPSSDNDTYEVELVGTNYFISYHKTSGTFSLVEIVQVGGGYYDPPTQDWRLIKEGNSVLDVVESFLYEEVKQFAKWKRMDEYAQEQVEARKVD